jgi:hypothetical protein
MKKRKFPSGDTNGFGDQHDLAFPGNYHLSPAYTYFAGTFIRLGGYQSGSKYLWNGIRIAARRMVDIVLICQGYFNCSLTRVNSWYRLLIPSF